MNTVPVPSQSSVAVRATGSWHQHAPGAPLAVRDPTAAHTRTDRTGGIRALSADVIIGRSDRFKYHPPFTLFSANRLRVYDIRSLIETLADVGSVLELRRDFAPGMVTAPARIEGRPIGIIANNPSHLGGAIDADAADKASRFMQLCDAFDVPMLYLCDTPGIMVGPEVERTALVRHSSRMFVTGANVNVPFFTIVLRTAYGLGAIAMAGGANRVPYFTVAWPTGEFHGMGIEGSIKLGYRDDLAAIADPAERKARFDAMVARAYENAKAIHSGTNFSVDDTIRGRNRG